MYKVYWIAFQSILAKEVHRFLRIWVQTLVPPAITMALYFAIFGNLIGGRIGEISGYSYMEFIVPGLIMMAIITNSYGNVASSFYSNKFQRNIEEILVAPVPHHIMILGYVAGGIARGVMVGIIVTLISLFFAKIQLHDFLVLFVTGIVTATVFSLGGLINAVYAKSFDDISVIPNFVLTPLTYLGGVFYSLDMLPKFWQIVSEINPIVYMISAFRYGFLGVTDVSLLASFSMLFLLIVVLYTIAYQLIKKGIGLKS